MNVFVILDLNLIHSGLCMHVCVCMRVCVKVVNYVYYCRSATH